MRILGITTLIVPLLFFARQLLFRNGAGDERFDLDSDVDAIFVVKLKLYSFYNFRKCLCSEIVAMRNVGYKISCGSLYVVIYRAIVVSQSGEAQQYLERTPH